MSASCDICVCMCAESLWESDHLLLCVLHGLQVGQFLLLLLLLLGLYGLSVDTLNLVLQEALLLPLLLQSLGPQTQTHASKGCLVQLSHPVIRVLGSLPHVQSQYRSTYTCSRMRFKDSVCV